MATRQQTKANKQNARNSTGPRTAAGKAKSSQNALKHGLRAQYPVLPDENLDDFEFLVSELEDQFQPQTALEWTLLRQLADAEWRMRRVPYLEAALLAAKIHESARYYSSLPERLPEDDAEADMVIIGAAAGSDASNGDTLSKLSRYESRLSHRYFKALEHLQRIQSHRQREPELEKRPPAAPGPNENVTHPGHGHDDSEVGVTAEVPVSPAASCAADNHPSRDQAPQPTSGWSGARPHQAPNKRDRKRPETEMARPTQARQTNPNARGDSHPSKIFRGKANAGGRVTVPVRQAAW